MSKCKSPAQDAANLDLKPGKRSKANFTSSFKDPCSFIIIPTKEAPISLSTSLLVKQIVNLESVRNRFPCFSFLLIRCAVTEHVYRHVYLENLQVAQDIYNHSLCAEDLDTVRLPRVHHRVMGTFVADIFTTASASIAMNDSWLIADDVSTTDVVTGASFQGRRIWNSAHYGQTTGDAPKGIGSGT